MQSRAQVTSVTRRVSRWGVISHGKHVSHAFPATCEASRHMSSLFHTGSRGGMRLAHHMGASAIMCWCSVALPSNLALKMLFSSRSSCTSRL